MSERLGDLIAVDGGAALELGIGTGRIALPLAAAGVPVHGIELSEAMVAKLREKPGGNIGLTIGDFSTTEVGATFSLVYLVFNTIMNLTTQAAQVACFRNVAAHLESGGCFVVEHDVASQMLTSHHCEIVDGRVERFSAPYRYVWPAELDPMAELARLALRERWDGWEREPFTSESPDHVSVWEKPRT